MTGNKSEVQTVLRHKDNFTGYSNWKMPRLALNQRFTGGLKHFSPLPSANAGSPPGHKVTSKSFPRVEAGSDPNSHPRKVSEAYSDWSSAHPEPIAVTSRMVNPTPSMWSIMAERVVSRTI